MKDKENEKAKSDDDARAYIMSLFPDDDGDAKLPPKPTKPSPNASAVWNMNRVTLQSILCKAKN